MPLGNFGRGIKDALVSTIRGAGDVLGTTIDTTRDTTVKALQSVRDVGGEASGLAVDGVTGAVQAASEVGSSVGLAAKGAVIGVIQGVGEVATVTVVTLSDTVRAAIKGTSEVGGRCSRCWKRCRRGRIGYQQERRSYPSGHSDQPLPGAPSSRPMKSVVTWRPQRRGQCGELFKAHKKWPKMHWWPCGAAQVRRSGPQQAWAVMWPPWPGTRWKEPSKAPRP